MEVIGSVQTSFLFKYLVDFTRTSNYLTMPELKLINLIFFNGVSVYYSSEYFISNFKLAVLLSAEDAKL